MKLTLLLISLLFSIQLLAQDGEPALRCSQAKDVSGTQGISYYQYPSMNKYDVKYLKLDLAVETGTRFISGTALTVARTLAPLDSFITELRDNMIVDSVFINGVKLPFVHSSDFIFIKLSSTIPVGNSVSALFYYRGTTSGTGVFSGNIASNGLNYTATLSESYQAREWFPAKQILKDKIDSADLWFTTTAINKVGSNGLLKSVTTLPGGKVQYKWKEIHPMSYYMPSFSVANYMEYVNYAKPLAMAPDSIPIQHYIANNAAYFAGIKPNLDKTPPFLEKMSELFGLYPFANEKYGHSHAGINGGMEHQTMSTMASFTSTIIAHELGHQWWGDNVTCATWNNIWLNEGFASYCEYLMIEKFPALIPSTNPPAFMQGFHSSAMSLPGGSVYVPDAAIFDENRIFDSRLSYAKGAAVIHTLRFELESDSMFFRVLKNYQQQFKDSVATTDDLKQVAETTSGKNLADYFNQWVYGQGYPTFNVTYLKEGTDVLVLRVNQTTSMPSVTPFFKGLYEFRIGSLQGDTIVKVYLTTNNQEFRFNYSKTPNSLVVDPNNWVMNNTGTITNGGVTAPASQVTLAATATADCGTVQLTWATTNEHNILKYEVEYSTNNLTFTKVGELAGNNTNSNQTHAFSYQPGIPAGDQYFRLKIIDSAGNSRFSNVVTQTLNCFDLRVGPVPVKDILHIYITLPQPGVANIALVNALGDVVFHDEKILIIGRSDIPVNLSRLAAGTYWLRIYTDGKKFIKKIVVM